MAQYRISVSSGQPFNIPQNSVSGSISGSWASIGNAVLQRPVRIQGIFWSCPIIGSELKIRELNGVVWYDAVVLSSELAIDLFQNYLTIFTPFEYFDSVGGNQIIIYGEYV